MKVFNNIAFAAPEIMLPNESVDLNKWAVIACDQYTSEIDYWNDVKAHVGDSASTLKLILPEVYLGIESAEQQEERLKNIADTAASYLANGTWNKMNEGVMLIDRKTDLHASRKGLIASIDLEQYSFEPGNKERIRATEGTVLSRIPPRVKIRANLPVELPHVMLLIDDPDKTVIEKAWNLVSANNNPTYDTKLFGKSGSIKGYFVDSNSSVFDGIVESLESLVKASADGMLFAVGDGNHSLASAKAHWDKVKENLSEEERKSHVARFALVEIVNIHDSGLDFEPIHRVVFGMDKAALISKATEYFKNSELTIDSEAKADAQNIVLVSEGEADVVMNIKNAPHTLAVGSIQMFLDTLEGVEVDYIHGDDSVRSLSKGNNTGIILPPVTKDSFFTTIAKEGVFPRKTFSMGEAFEKRFYLEAKMIK